MTTRWCGQSRWSARRSRCSPVAGVPSRLRPRAPRPARPRPPRREETQGRTRRRTTGGGSAPRSRRATSVPRRPPRGGSVRHWNAFARPVTSPRSRCGGCSPAWATAPTPSRSAPSTPRRGPPSRLPVPCTACGSGTVAASTVTCAPSAYWPMWTDRLRSGVASNPAPPTGHNTAHSRLRAPGERAAATVESRRLLRKLRCCPPTRSSPPSSPSKPPPGPRLETVTRWQDCRCRHRSGSVGLR